MFMKLSFRTIHESETLGTRKRFLRTKCERYSCAILRPVIILIFHTFLCIFSRNSSQLSGSRGKLTNKCMDKVQNAVVYYIPQLFFCKILYLVAKVSNS